MPNVADQLQDALVGAAVCWGRTAQALQQQGGAAPLHNRAVLLQALQGSRRRRRRACARAACVLAACRLGLLCTAPCPPGGRRLLLVVRRVEALGKFLDSDDGKNLLAGTKRAANILRIEEKKDGVAYAGAPDAKLLALPEEKTLAAAIDAALDPLPDRLGVNKRKFYGAVRVAECGNQVSPPLGESLELLGKADLKLTRHDATLPRMAVAAQMPAIAVTDSNNMFCALEFSVLAKDAGL